MLHAAVVASEQRGGFGSDDRGFEVRAGEGADGVERTPGGLDENLHLIARLTGRNSSSKKTGDPA